MASFLPEEVCFNDCLRGRLLKIRNLSIGFGGVSVVDGLSLTIPRGKTVALVGESGCGKSVTALSILRLIPSPPGNIAGEIVFFDESNGAQAKVGGTGTTVPKDALAIDLLKLSDRPMRRIRGNRIAMVFQEPMTSLNPVLSVGEQIVEVLRLHQGFRRKRAWLEATELLGKVGIAHPRRRVRDYPHQMSGGMRQRVMIAIALACHPSLLIADEPTTALDVTTQRQILDLITTLQHETDMSVLWITHNLPLVAHYAEDVYVMYAGRIVEHAPARELLQNPRHPYTQGLLRCAPCTTRPSNRLQVIPGQVPDPQNMPSGCRFHPRCTLTQERAPQSTRESVRVNDSERIVLRRCVESYDGEPSGVPKLAPIIPDHFVACWEC